MPTKPILTIDVETDPFRMGHPPGSPQYVAPKQTKYHDQPGTCQCGCRLVHPFACGLTDGKMFYSIWHKNCCDEMVKVLERMEPSIVYMHNGGRFDDYFFYRHFAPERKRIGGRIAVARLGHHEFRDSMSIIPVALKETGEKKDIEIWKLEREHRDNHRAEILSYLEQDCVGLHKLVTQFREEFGDHLTIASAAMKQLSTFHPFQKTNSVTDWRFRSQFFFGGRTQFFASGVIEKPFKIYDMNSAYPYVMRNFKHPADGDDYNVGTKVTRKTGFVIVEGVNRGAFPLRAKDGGIDFTCERGTFACSIHEWHMAEQTKMFSPTRVIKTYDFDEWISFDGFVDHFYGARMKAQAAGDKIHKLFYKLILNSAYGKFAQNPELFVDEAVTLNGAVMPTGWTMKAHRGTFDNPMYTVWSRPAPRHTYFNVSIGASITGGTRAMLMEGLSKSSDPYYCDTDSIICRDLKSVPFSDTELGAWKLEGVGNKLAIAMKKTYACFDTSKTCSCPDGGYSATCQYHVKRASKGAQISSEEIEAVAKGETVWFHKLAPTFKMDGRVEFIHRRINRTV